MQSISLYTHWPLPLGASFANIYMHPFSRSLAVDFLGSLTCSWILLSGGNSWTHGPAMNSSRWWTQGDWGRRMGHALKGSWRSILPHSVTVLENFAVSDIAGTWLVYIWGCSCVESQYLVSNVRSCIILRHKQASTRKFLQYSELADQSRKC